MESEPPPQQIESADRASQPPPPERDATGSASRWPSLRPDPLLVACFVALIAFPLTAALAASRQPIAPEPEAAAAAPPAASGPTVRAVPAFTPGGQVAAAVERGKLLTDFGAMRGTLRSAMGEVFDRRERAAFESLLDDNPFGASPPDRVLDSALSAPLDEPTTAAANDLGALLVLAAARFPDRVPNAAPLAYAVLGRARSGDACLPQLNLAFLLSTNTTPLDAETARELREAERRCPGDPTPLWLLGQFQSQRAVLDASSRFAPPVTPTEQLRARSRPSTASSGVFRARPQAGRGLRTPSSGWHTSCRIRGTSRFAATTAKLWRCTGRRARSTRIQRSRRERRAPRRDSGSTRKRHVRSSEALTREQPRPAQLQARLVEYLERARAFGAAAEEAGAPRRLAPVSAGARPVHGARRAEEACWTRTDRGRCRSGVVVSLGVQLDVAPLTGSPRMGSPCSTSPSSPSSGTSRG